MKQNLLAKTLVVGFTLTLFTISTAHATNGMALSGYGPVAMSMGGAATAYDNGNYGAINNPATLALMEDGKRFEAGANIMHVDAQTWMTGVEPVDSSAEWFAMPTISYMVKNGVWTYGIGAYTQGGMGANYGHDSFLSVDPNSGMPTGLPNESEVMMGRLIIPLALESTERLTVGASVNLVYGRLTMKQLVPRQTLADMMTPGLQTLGIATADPVTAQALGSVNYAHLDLEKLYNWGYGGQIGLTFKASPGLTFGASYQFETNVGDLEADAAIHAGVGNNYQSISGKAKIKDPQWPATLKFGAALQATDNLLLVADVKRYQWFDVLNTFSIRFKPDEGGFVNIDMYQKWDDQTVYSLGGEYTLNPRIKLRAGFNYGVNPVPREYLQHLAEAITEKHLMFGASLKTSGNVLLDLSYTHTFENEVTNTSPLVGVTGAMSQDSLNLNYSYMF